MFSVCQLSPKVVCEVAAADALHSLYKPAHSRPSWWLLVCAVPGSTLFSKIEIKILCSYL